MSGRIRDLEDALQACHAERAAVGLEVHPLLRPEYLGIKSTMGLYSCAQPCSPEMTHPRKLTSQTATENNFNNEVTGFPRQPSSTQVSMKHAHT